MNKERLVALLHLHYLQNLQDPVLNQSFVIVPELGSTCQKPNPDSDCVKCCNRRHHVPNARLAQQLRISMQRLVCTSSRQSSLHQCNIQVDIA